MTQPLEDNRLYSSWSRTPGKPSSSSNFVNTKISNISSSTDSGVGRTPNWNSDSDNQFNIYDSTLWSSNDIIDNSKKNHHSWDESTNKIGNNFTLGFCSQWPTNTESASWSLSRNNSSDFIAHESNKLESNCWKNANNISSNHNSIWPADNNQPIVVASDCHNANHNSNNKSSKSILSPELSEKSDNFPLFSAFTADSNSLGAVVSDNGSCLESSVSSSAHPASGTSHGMAQGTQGNSEPQTWAQAAGKGLMLERKHESCVTTVNTGATLSSAISTTSTGSVQTIDNRFELAINRLDGWGSHTVDQSTPWIIDTVPTGGGNSGECGGSQGAMQSMLLSTGSGSGGSSSIDQSGGNRLTSMGPGSSNNSGVGCNNNNESNVWTSEPPTGVGVWESHYEAAGMIGAERGRYGAVHNTSHNNNHHLNSHWNDRDDVWSNVTVNSGNNCSNKSNWTVLAQSKQSIDQQQSIAANSMGAGSSTRNGSSAVNMISNQRNSNAATSFPSEMSDRHSYYQNQNINMMSTNRMAANTKTKQMMNVGFRKDDSQNSLYNNSMEMNRPYMDMKSSSLNHSNMMGSRSEWNIPHENFCVNNVENDNSAMMGSGYMAQSMLPSNNQSMKSHMMQQMQMQTMGNRLPSENHMLLEKQIIAEITQLHNKQQELVQRINGLRSIAGSQTFIQEMNRTLSEVRQQLNTQQTTLKVIRSQRSIVNNQMPNGMINNSNSNNPLMSMVSRTMQPSASAIQSQSQSGLVSDLSAQMSDLKLQKNRMDLWSQGNLPSPNTISPFMGADKTGGFYNPSIPNGGPINPQPFSNFNRNSQMNCISSHRQANQMWQSRMMQNSNSAATSTGALAFNVGTDSSSIINNGPNVNDDIDSLSINNSSLSKLPITPYCTSDSTGNNSTANSANTTALSLSQTLSSSTGSRVSSAFSSSRDISHISANISEFVPGQPWPGIIYSQRDDPNVTLGTGPRSLLSITNDHLEKLANPNVNTLNGPNDVGGNNNVNRLSSSLNGVCSGGNRANMTYILIHDLPSHINIEMLKNVLTPHSFPGLSHMHPNLTSRWVLLHFSSNEEALKAYKNLYSKVGVVELLSDQDVNQVIRGPRNNGIIDHPLF